MSNQTFVTVVGLVTAAAVFATGIVIITGLLLPTSVPGGSRILVGCVMIGYGVYRSIMLWKKHRSEKNEISREQ
jgi:hypothetical protein